jgi:predicted nucleic acid-binding protein
MSLVFIDTSVWARIKQEQVREPVADAVSSGSVVISEPLILELLRSARNAKEHKVLRDEYESLHVVPLTQKTMNRALEVQSKLAIRGYHRGPSPTDLISAAVAESVGATLWHCDRDFELIAEVSGQVVVRLGR